MPSRLLKSSAAAIPATATACHDASFQHVCVILSQVLLVPTEAQLSSVVPRSSVIRCSMSRATATEPLADGSAVSSSVIIIRALATRRAFE